MANIVETWTGMSARSKVGIAGGAVLIVALMGGLGWWAYRADYQILFADLAPADAAAMTAEMDKMKTPYQLADGGNTIMVPRDLVYKTRLKLMGKDVPLHGAVGFEVFNNADFGMTEFVQKVNYLRAIQGELTRTILSIDDIQAARVHLALPEQGLFKKAGAKPKASVTVTMKSGRVLAPDQINGIQRLVAASVPDIVSGDVTVLNQHGVALTRVAQADGLESASTQLDSKRSAEEYLLKKVTQVLDRTYGAGEAVASVDVVLNLDQSKVTTEEVLPARNSDPQASAAGVVVREKTVTHEGSPAVGGPLAGGARSGGTPANTSNEFDYQVGRRVEQVVSASGTVKRMTVAVLVKQPMNEEQLAKLKEVVALATGLNTQRGDAVVAYSMGALASQAVGGSAVPAGAAEAAADGPAPAAANTAPAAAGSSATRNVIVVLSLLAGAIAVWGIAYLQGRRQRPSAPRQLAAAEREQMLDDVRRWIGASADAAGNAP